VNPPEVRVLRPEATLSEIGARHVLRSEHHRCLLAWVEGRQGRRYCRRKRSSASRVSDGCRRTARAFQPQRAAAGLISIATRNPLRAIHRKQSPSILGTGPAAESRTKCRMLDVDAQVAIRLAKRQRQARERTGR